MGIFQDWNCNFGAKSKCIIVAYRIGNILYRKRKQLTPFPFYAYLCLYRFIVEWVFGVELTLKAQIGNRLTIFHGVGLVINPKVLIGDDVTLRNGVVIGNKGGDLSGCPVIGNNVDIGANAVIIGDITIGNGVKIGAGAVVVKSLNDNEIAVSAPIRIIRSTNKNVD